MNKYLYIFYGENKTHNKIFVARNMTEADEKAEEFMTSNNYWEYKGERIK